jgi:putative aldouronate transport system substrate-binding protein
MKARIAKRAGALGLSVAMISGITACGNQDAVFQQTPYVPNPEKPESITMVMDTCITEENGLQKVCDQYKENTGIELVVEKPSHNQYYEKVTIAFTGGKPADVLEVGSTYYPKYARAGALWDMSEAWEKTTANAKNIVDEQYVDALKTYGKDGKEGLFGFPMAAGNGTITYVRQDWLDKIGMSEGPKNYDEFIDMLTKFKDLDGVTPNGESVIPYTAAGLINTETPYEIYLREFYWEASPDFIVDESTGQYVDGFTTPEFQAALERIKDAYNKGLIDKEIATNKTDAARKKVTSGICGTFNYWAGMWDAKLENSLVKVAPDAKLTAIEPIAETTYIERVPTALAITACADNPSGIFEYLVMYSHDGGEGQMLFTHGVEGLHYKKDGVTYDGLVDKKGNAVDYDRETTGNGETVALGYLADPEKDVEKSFYAPELTITDWDDPIKYDDRVSTSLATFRANRTFATVPRTTRVIERNLSSVDTAKRTIAAKFVNDPDMTIEQAMQEYQKKVGKRSEHIIEELNNLGK